MKFFEKMSILVFLIFGVGFGQETQIGIDVVQINGEQLQLIGGVRFSPEQILMFEEPARPTEEGDFNTIKEIYQICQTTRIESVEN